MTFDRHHQGNDMKKFLVAAAAAASILAGAATAYAFVHKWLQNLPDYQSKHAFDVALEHDAGAGIHASTVAVGEDRAPHPCG